MVISDTAMFAENVPSHRATACAASPTWKSSCSGAGGDLHSGIFGGAVINPANALAQMLAWLQGRTTAASPYRASTTTCAADRRGARRFAALAYTDELAKREDGVRRPL